MRLFGKLVLIGCFIIPFLFLLPACKQKLDKDGGFYDEKTRTYKYVKPKGRGSAQQVYAPRPGEIQTIGGTVARIGEDAKSVWVKIEERKPYMIMASSLSSNNRDDKNKLIRLSLSFVSPAGSISGSRNFRQQWKKYATQVMGNELLNQKVLVEFNYEERSRRFFGNLYQTVKTKDGSQTRDINLWIIRRGLSFYFIDQGRSKNDKEYLKAQQIARKGKQGVWQY